MKQREKEGVIIILLLSYLVGFLCGYGTATWQNKSLPIEQPWYEKTFRLIKPYLSQDRIRYSIELPLILKLPNGTTIKQNFFKPEEGFSAYVEEAVKIAEEAVIWLDQSGPMADFLLNHYNLKTIEDIRAFLREYGECRHRASLAYWLLRAITNETTELKLAVGFFEDENGGYEAKNNWLDANHAWIEMNNNIIDFAIAAPAERYHGYVYITVTQGECLVCIKQTQIYYQYFWDHSS